MNPIASVSKALHMHDTENKAIRRHALNTKDIQVIFKDYNKILSNLMKQDDALSLHEENLATSLYKNVDRHKALSLLAESKAKILNTTSENPYIFNRRDEISLLKKIIYDQPITPTASAQGKLNACLERIDYAAKNAEKTRAEYQKVLAHLNAHQQSRFQFKENILKIEQHVKYYINRQESTV